MLDWWFFDIPMWIFVTTYSVIFWFSVGAFGVYSIERFFGTKLLAWWREKVVNRYKVKSNSGDDTYMNPDDWGV